MRVAEWTFLSRTHPLYEMVPGTDRWPFTPPEFEMAEPLRTDDEGFIVERMEMRMAAFRQAVRIYRLGLHGPTVQEVRLRSRYTREMDLGPVVEVARRWLDAMRQLSRGPYSLRQLRLMGHPYGWGAPGQAAWQRFRQPRRMPYMGRHRYLRGVRLRGAMPDRAVINLQTGRLYRSWRMEVRALATGLVIRFIAGTRYAWYLARGTVRMQPHGPWGPVARRMMPQLFEAWRRAAWEAWRKQRALEGQFGRPIAEGAGIWGEAGGWQ